MSIVATFAEPPRRRKRGRPRDIENKAKRETQIRHVTLVLSQALSVKEVASMLGLSRHTITEWCERLLTDWESDTDGLRALAENYPRRRPRLYTRR
jgi:transposase